MVARRPPTEAMLAALLACGLLGLCRGARVKAPAAAVAEAVDDFGLDENVWLGLEDDNASGFEPLPGLAPPGPPGAVSAANVTVQSGSLGGAPVLMMGMFNTGTNLLAKLLSLNFGIHHTSANGIWKHIKPEHLKQQLAEKGMSGVLQAGGTVGIAVVRDPISWIQSMRKAPYDLRGCMAQFDWSTSSCTFPRPRVQGSTIWAHGISHESDFHVQNIEWVWNEWNSEYDQLASVAGFAPGKTVVLTYEELVLDTVGALGKIAAVLGRPAPTSVKHIFAPAKTHGQANGRMQAIAKLRNKPYLRSYSKVQLQQVCERLNKPLMLSHNYHDCDSL